MTQRNPKSNEPVAILADLAFEDLSFPKYTDDFDEVSRYLEDGASFSFNLGQFDQIWEEYVGHWSDSMLFFYSGYQRMFPSEESDVGLFGEPVAFVGAGVCR